MQDEPGGASKGTPPVASLPAKVAKRKLEDGNKQKAPPQQRQQEPPQKHKKQNKSKKANPKKVAAKKAIPAHTEAVVQGSEAVSDGPPKINPHRAKILVGKKALAAIKEGTSEPSEQA